MITNFLFLFTQVAPIQHIPSPFFELVDGQISVPRCFPSKKAHPHGSPRPPSKTPRKRVTIGPHEGGVEGSNRENVIPTFLSTQYILQFSSHYQMMQFSEQALHLFQFPRMPWEVRIPTTRLPTPLPSIWHLLIFVNHQPVLVKLMYW